ncbi:hypothetical protein [Lacticaseibacillus paracasei]|uniref:hypothetical protein n=1 Tax=Lacticaseibacillus paracasei TaxID=1597 RepID=UPI0002973869|nr:hypothetical protein [Lacticaseibacillus paracasei]EKQ06132.1 hypothetical protein LCAM36_0072 [Lacticaseibacillus paracasei]EPC24092.1 hypothetical protein Lpp17_1985 [Lacticaseibacillus paracasei subsp. paracasei Lpp17]MBM6452775.1 hypothetical protein [Lacticaseibacillus paracasei]MCP9305964.1 hypothetical protein [Lacticaseibacillus paracasei]
MVLKYNDFMKHGASNLLLWAPVVPDLFEHPLLGSLGDFFDMLFLVLGLANGL